MRRAREPRHGIRATHRDAVARLEVVLLSPVERDNGGLVLHLELEHLVGVEDDGIREREVRRDRDHRDRARGGQDERPPDREAVRRAPGGRRDDQAVGPVHDEQLAVDAHGYVDGTYLLPARDDHVVQRQAARELPAGAHRASVE